MDSLSVRRALFQRPSDAPRASDFGRIIRVLEDSQGSLASVKLPFSIRFLENPKDSEGFVWISEVSY